ncbi:hypothetical protein Clacol_005578 [Clathrus columnatus]|uniref:Uncharacterized protein n=1 Tax=Clathrus columnatus TaxID=1419009 RepID=A0AAV5AFT4_9AGAM|nr:hypothetical protein Clacol_005578 [Clathrus columnatus]
MEDVSSVSESGSTGTDEDINPGLQRLEELLHTVQDLQPLSAEDLALSKLSWKEFPALEEVKQKLSIKSKDKKLDVIFRTQLFAMIATLNFYLAPDLTFTWREASLLAAKALGKGEKFARNLHQWIHLYLRTGRLLLHRYGKFHSSILEDEDLQEEIQLRLME